MIAVFRMEAQTGTGSVPGKLENQAWHPALPAQEAHSPGWRTDEEADSRERHGDAAVRIGMGIQAARLRDVLHGHSRSDGGVFRPQAWQVTLPGVQVRPGQRGTGLLRGMPPRAGRYVLVENHGMSRTSVGVTGKALPVVPQDGLGSPPPKQAPGMLRGKCGTAVPNGSDREYREEIYYHYPHYHDGNRNRYG